MNMKIIKLLTAAHVAGVLRHPHEGAIPVSDADAARLIESEAATDVTDDFSAAERKQMTEQPVTTAVATPAAKSEPHQSEVAPAADNEKARKAASSKE